MAFKETRLNLEPSSSAFVVDVKLPTIVSQGRSRLRQVASHNSSNISNGNGSGRHDDSSVETDTLRTRTCATASSTYHRRHHNYPKSFLWRILDNDSILSIRAIDVLRPGKVADANLILNFHFPHAIRPACVALADPEDHDALTVFVLDTAQQLYTLFLRPESFRKRAFVETGLADVCKIYQPNALKIKHPHRLFAIGNDQLVATLSDGGLVRFDRHKSSQQPWRETFYNSKGWTHGLRSILGARSELDVTAAAAAVQTSLGLDTASFLFTVCLDHRLRVWNLNSGQILGAMDLLDAERNPNETGKWQLDPSQANLIRIVGQTEGKRLCITYSPVGSGEFKFWRLRSDNADSVDVDSLYSDVHLIPKPPPGSDVWTLADFIVEQSLLDDGFQTSITIWVLWKNNMAYRVQRLSFTMPDDGDTRELLEDWAANWSTVISDAPEAAAPQSGPTDPIDVTEKWLRIILTPGRFPKPTLEAALKAFQRTLGKTDDIPHHNRDMAESICSVIASTSSLARTETGDMDHEQFRNSSEQQWRKFFRVLTMLDKPRGEALALAYESESGLPWVVCADRLSAIRGCSELETICYDSHSRDHLATLIRTGRQFMENFSDGMLQICNSVLRSELFEETTKTDYERIQHFSDKTGFWRQIFEDSCTQVTEALGQNFNHVTDSLYEQVLDTCNQTSRLDQIQFPLTDFGRWVALKATQDTAELQWNVCFSQLILLVHMEFDFDQPEEALHNRVDVGSVYRDLLGALQRLELLRWLGNTQLSTPLPKAERAPSVIAESPVASKRQVDESVDITALELVVWHLLGFQQVESMPASIADVAASLCARDSDVELEPHRIQSTLLVRDRPDLALELTPFCGDTPFTAYIQGRVHLALKDFRNAATYFKKAAYGMSIPQVTEGKYHSGGLLNDTDTQLFHQGQLRYYSHIVALYEKHKAYSYVVDFARLSMQFANTTSSEVDRKEMQSRLFNGALATSHFELAHSTLVTMRDRALQHSCLQKLVQKMCDNLHNSELVRLPFPGLQGAVDELLAQRSRETVDVVTGVPYHQILYSWRIQHNDYRGAAAVLLDRIHKLRQLGEADEPTGNDDVLDTAVTRQYLMLINVLSCIDAKQAWVTTTEGSAQGGTGKRRVVTLADVRREYQEELDRIAAIDNNQFGFAAGDEMEIL
jgi:nuclear pore complex protein Nup160